MGPLGGGQEAVAGWAPWGRREGGEGGGMETSPGPPHRCSGEGLGQCEGQRLSTLPAHPANDPSVLQLNNAFRTCGSAVHKLHEQGLMVKLCFSPSCRV